MTSDMEHKVWEALREVSDPELGLNIVELGLVREIILSDEYVQVSMTLTTPACPYAPDLMVATEKCAAETVGGGRKGVVTLVWDPPWDPRKDASEDALAELGVW